MTNYPRGSEWRRWDLHVHSPFSILNSQFSSDFDSYAKTLFEKALARGIGVVGITDYFTIEGYKALRRLKAEPGRLEHLLGAEAANAARRIRVLPNIELRLRELVRKADGNEARLNFHVIFSDQIPVESIEENFLQQLRFTHQAHPDTPDERSSLTKANLEALGARLKEDHAGFRGRGDLYVGAVNAVVSHEQISTELSDQRGRFEGRYVLAAPADEDLAGISWDGQGHLTRKVLIQKSHLLFSSNKGTREFALGRRHATVEKFRAEFGSTKACVHGSDAHREDEIFEPAEHRYCWIKADPTFDGLRQLLFEPEARVHIGTEPPELDRSRRNATRQLDRLVLGPSADAHRSEKWFDSTLELNPGLIAIIGRKGSGKSAVADVVALLGEARNSEDFSFLTRSRFLAPKAGLADAFAAELTWRSGEHRTKRLSDGVDHSQPERVEYIPQSYLERICTELQDADGPTRFDDELEAVIFSHVDGAERLGRRSLRALVEHRTAEKEAGLVSLREQLHNANECVVELRRHLTAAGRAQLEARLAQRRLDLESHDTARPTSVAQPDNGTNDASSQPALDLAAAVRAIQDLDAQMAGVELQRRVQHERIVAIDRLLSRADNLAASVEAFYDASSKDEALAGTDVRALVQIRVNRTPLITMRAHAATELEALDQSIDRLHEGSLANRRAEASTQAATLRQTLDEPTRLHEEYRRRLNVWERERAQIIGAPEVEGSIAALEVELESLQFVLPQQLEDAQRLRGRIRDRIFGIKADLLADYERLHSPVRAHVNQHPVALEIQALAFSTTMALDRLVDGFLSFIHQGRRGSFQGEAEGRALLRALIAEHSFDTAAHVGVFLDAVGHALTHDLRADDSPTVALDKQLLPSRSEVELYDYLFGLDWLQPRFELRWQDKPLSQLSPGERGTLLLVFFLLVDQRDEPLVVDQPEENLDNETIAALLVPAIKYAKGRRQVIVVTHNPNLAVVCDADQIIHASIDKADGNAITYESGSLENPLIAQRIVDVLEGTKPAFDLRSAKYRLLSVGVND